VVIFLRRCVAYFCLIFAFLEYPIRSVRAIRVTLEPKGVNALEYDGAIRDVDESFFGQGGRV
jgi:hypothetical protein